MSPRGRPKGSCRRAQHEGTPVSGEGFPSANSRLAGPRAARGVRQ